MPSNGRKMKANNLRYFLGLVALSIFLVGVQSSAPYWTQIQQYGDVPQPVSDGAAAFADGKFYVFGGLNGSYPVDFPVKHFAVFDVATSTWRDLSGYPFGPRESAECMMFIIGDDVYVSGCRGPFRRQRDITYSSTYRFNYVTGWFRLNPNDERANRSCEAAVFAKNKNSYRAYAFSGSSSTVSAFANKDGGFKNDTVEFKPQSGWKVVPVKGQSPLPRGHHCIINHDDSLFTYGGYTKDALYGNSTFSERNYLGDLWEFDIAKKTWKEHVPSSGPTPGKRDNSKLFYDETHNRLWLYGGADWNFGASFNDLWYYSFDTKTWANVTSSITTDLPPSRIGFLFYDEIFDDRIEFTIFGGSSSEFGTLFNDMWRLTVPLDF